MIASFDHLPRCGLRFVAALLLFSFILSGCSQLAPMPDESPNTSFERISHIQSLIKKQQLSTKDYETVRKLSDASVELSLCYQKLAPFVGGSKSFASSTDVNAAVKELMGEALQKITFIRAIPLPQSLAEWNARLYNPAIKDFEYVALHLPDACEREDYTEINACFVRIGNAGAYFDAAGQLLESWAPAPTNNINKLRGLE